MKRCPKCRADYFDEMLEFCLEDGAKLAVVGSAATAANTQVLTADQNSIETNFFGDRAGLPQTMPRAELSPTVQTGNPVTTSQASANAAEPVSLKEKTVEKGYRALETGTLVLALAHNWLQWLYIERQHYGTLANFILSAEFLIWILLLLAGTTAGFLTLKFSRQKALAYAGLIIFAINFLLLLVPKR